MPPMYFFSKRIKSMTEIITALYPTELHPACTGWQDSNLRHPAPKAKYLSYAMPPVCLLFAQFNYMLISRICKYIILIYYRVFFQVSWSASFPVLPLWTDYSPAILKCYWLKSLCIPCCSYYFPFWYLFPVVDISI